MFKSSKFILTRCPGYVRVKTPFCVLLILFNLVTPRVHLNIVVAANSVFIIPFSLT